MNFVASDELERTDEAFARNRLLATFSPESRALLEPHASLVEFELGSVIHARGAGVDYSYFPFGPTMISLRLDLTDGRTIEVASIGQEGAVGGIVSCGQAPAFAHAEVMVAGPALKVPMAMREEAKERSGHIRNLFCRFSDYLLAQVMQSVACNAFHSIEARAARWLLTAQDRAGSRIELTQEALAGLLGAQRTTVNAVVRTLQDEGLIASRRGMIQVVDRTGLTRRACECYAALEGHFTGIIGTSGSGGTASNPDCD
jgi:CRP-like cAMP-binding protein